MAASRLKKLDSGSESLAVEVLESSLDNCEFNVKGVPSLERDDSQELGCQDKWENDEDLSQEYPIKKMITAVTNLDELCEVLSTLHEINGSQVHTSRDVIASIREIQEFFGSHSDELMISVINHSDSYYKDSFGQKLNAITRGGDLNIRTKVKDILVAELNRRFETKRADLVTKAIAEVTSLLQLFGIIEKFKAVNVALENKQLKETLRYSPEQAIKVILGAQNQLVAMFNGDKINRINSAGQSMAISAVMDQWRVPYDSGIYDKVEELLTVEMEEMNLKMAVAEMNHGAVSRFGSRLRSFFGH
ncbi:MAG: hypothetical protein PHW95_03355 [Patescibacteria group bacterium]|nr:hypothetical protein [Patescibacteria group bacterium]